MFCWYLICRSCRCPFPCIGGSSSSRSARIRLLRSSMCSANTLPAIKSPAPPTPTKEQCQAETNEENALVPSYVHDQPRVVFENSPGSPKLSQQRQASLGSANAKHSMHFSWPAVSGLEVPCPAHTNPHSTLAHFLGSPPAYPQAHFPPKKIAPQPLLQGAVLQSHENPCKLSQPLFNDGCASWLSTSSGHCLWP